MSAAPSLRPIDPEVVRSFTEVVLRCLRTTVGIDAVAANVGAASTRATIAVAIDFRGDFRGPVTWVFPPTVAIELFRRLMDEPDPGDEAAEDGATELANILTGSATAALESFGFRCEIGVPRLHVGALPDGVAVRLNSAAGPIDLVLSMSREG